MKHIILYLLIFVTAKFSSAQTLSCEEMEINLRNEYMKILEFHGKNNYDSLEIQNKTFLKTLNFYTQYFPETITYPFKSLTDSFEFNIVLSEDSLFRIYNWNTWTGGTWFSFKCLYQFKNKGDIYSLYYDDNDSIHTLSYGASYSEIFTLKANDKIYYLGIEDATYSSRDCNQYIKIFRIDNGLLDDTIKLIKTKTRIRNRLGFNYDFFSVANRPERPVKLISYDSQTKTINIPVVLENGKVTNKFIHYKFTGQYFEKVNIKKHK